MRLFLMIFTMLSFLGVASAAPTKELVLTKDNTLVLNSAFNGKSVSTLIGQAKKLNADLKSGYPIYLFLDTPGGEIQAGIELVEYLNGINRPVHTVTLFAASMGWQLLQHLGTRYVLKYGVLMSHKARGGFSGEFGGGGSQIDSRYGLWLRRLNMMDQQTVNKTNGKKTLKQYQSDYDNELWLNGPEAVKHGYADEVATIKCGASLNGIRFKKVRYRGFKLKVGFDKCPITTYPLSVEISVRTNQGYMSLDDFLDTGGIFGEKCRNESIPPRRDYNGNVIAGVKPQLCLMNTKLTFEDLQKSKEQEVADIRKAKRNIILMTFGNFINGL